MKSQLGYTLVELIVVVAIVAILAAIAVPSYNEQVLRGQRADGKAFIMDLASRLERFYTQYSSYTTTVVGAGGCAGAACGLNLGANASAEGFYSAAITATPNGCAPNTAAPCITYSITVTPNVVDTKCTSLSIDNLGQESHTGSAATTADCWR